MTKGPPITPQARVLAVAGSDSGGGAGIQADLKTITALGAYGATAITAITVQNTLGVSELFELDSGLVARQMEAVLGDIGADAIKTGMLFSAQIVNAVAATSERLARKVPLVIDPVMVSKDGTSLLDAAGRRALVERLIPRAALVTPNAPEAEILSGVAVRDVGDLARAADRLLVLGCGAVLIKGGHLPGDKVIDLLRTADGFERSFESPRLQTRATHGTGCTLASAVAVGIAEGLTLEHAVERARNYVFEAMRRAHGHGRGHAPLNHAYGVRS